MTYLNYSVLVEEEMLAREQELKLQLEKAVSQKVRALQLCNAGRIYDLRFSDCRTYLSLWRRRPSKFEHKNPPMAQACSARNSLRGTLI